MSVEKIIDCRGLACPQPVILTKKAIDEAPDTLVVIVDNFVAKENVVKFAAANGYGASVEPEGNLFRIRMLARQKISDHSGNNAAATDIPAVYLITQDTLGNGSEELGAILMKAFFVSLQEIKPWPSALFFLNSGVRLTTEGSLVLNALLALAEGGVSIMSCGTCLDYFQLKDKLVVGTVTNMYTILSESNGPGRTITL